MTLITRIYSAKILRGRDYIWLTAMPQLGGEVPCCSLNPKQFIEGQMNCVSVKWVTMLVGDSYHWEQLLISQVCCCQRLKKTWTYNPSALRKLILKPQVATSWVSLQYKQYPCCDWAVWTSELKFMKFNSVYKEASHMLLYVYCLVLRKRVKKRPTAHFQERRPRQA